MLEERAPGPYLTRNSGGSRSDVEAEVRESNAAPVDKLFLYLKDSVALDRQRTIPTERPPPVGEVSVNFCG